MPKYKPLYSLYKGLRESKYDVPDSYASFQKTLTQAGNAGAKSRRGLYQSLKDSNYDVPDTYEDFYKNLFVPVNSTTSRALKIGENPNTPTVNRYRQKMFDSVDPNKNGLNNLSNRAVGQAVRATNNVRKPVIAKVVNQKGKPTGKEFAITPAKTAEDLDREYAQETTKNWENELHDQIADADKDAAKISDMFKSFIGSTDEVGSVWGNMTRGGGIAGTPHSVTTNNGILENTEARQILAAGDYNRKRRELLQLEQDSRNGAIFDNHSFFRGMYDAAKDTGFLTGGASDLINAGSLLATKQDLDNGVHTEAGDMLMQQAVKNSNAQSQYGDNQGWMYTGGVITTNMAPFMVQIGSAGFSKGMSNVIGKVVQGTASKVALGTMEKATGMAGAHIANYIGKVTGLTTKAFGKAVQYGIVGAAQANTVGLGNVANDVINRYTGQVYQDEQGSYKFGTFDSDGNLVHEGGEDFLTSLVKGDAAQTIEFATELAGGGIDAVGTALKNFVTKGGKKIINKYNMENVSKVIDFLLNNKVSKNARYLKAGADRTLGKVELNSIVGESLEEELGIIANTVFTGDNKISDLWDEKQQSQIWGGMLLSIGLMKGAVAPFHAYNAKQYYYYKHKLDKADVNLSQLLGKEKWEELRNQIDATTNDDMPEMVNKINRDVALGKNRQPVREYIQNLLIMRGYDIGNMLAAKKAVEDKGEGVSVKNMEKNQAYQQGRDAYGYDTHEIQLDQEDKQKSLAQLIGISEQQLASMSDEELEALSGRDDNIDRAIYDYQLSTARYEGVIDNARDQIDLEVQRAAQAVDMYTDKSSNTIRNATIKATGGLEDYGVYIINGNIATHEDGSIDISNSDDMILYYDPTTNTVEHADAMMFAELGSEENADEVRSQAMADAKEKAIKETTGIIDGVVEVGTQFNLIDTDGTEHTYEVLADNGDGTAMITIDGNVPTELVNGENVNIPVSFEELQKMKDEYDQQRLQAAKAEREQMEKERAEQQTQETEQSQPSFDFNQILNDNGNVVLVDVLDKDGNTKYPDSRLFLIRDAGAKAKVVELKSDGTIVPHAVNKEDVATISSMSLDEYKQAMPESSMIEDNSGENIGEIEVETPTIEGETAAPSEETAAPSEETAAPESAETPATEQTPAAPAITLEDGTIVPMLEDGNPDFSKLTAAQTAELYDTQFGEDADSIVSGYVSDAKKALDKASNMTVKGKTFVEQKAAKDAKEKAIANAQAAYDSAIAIRDAYNERQLAKVEDTAEGRKKLIEKARRKFARLKSAVKDDAESVAQLYKETIGSLLHRLYDGTGIDVTDTIPLTAEEYVASNLGAHSLNYEGTETSKGVKQETGLSREDFSKTQLLAADGKGTTIDALVHSLWENRPSNLESLDTQDIRNALIGVLNSGFKASEARNFVENIRIAQAESILEEQKRAQEDAAYSEQHKAEPEAELKAKSDEKAELKAKSEAKLDNESDNKSNDLSNESDNENINDNINDNINTPEVPEDATDENPLGLQLSEDKVPFEIEGGKSGETYDINDNEDRQRLISDNKVDDKDILDIDMPKHVHKAIKELCKKMGLKVQFLYMGARSNGWIENGTMYLALDTEKATQFVFGHEMTHAIKQKNPEAYKELVKVAMAVTTKKKFEEDLAKVYQNYHGISGYNNVDDYVEEVVADNLGKFINDFDLAQKFSLRLNHPILGTILHAIQKIKSLLYGDFYKSVDALERIVEKAYVETANGQVTNSETGEDVSFSLRQKPEPKKKGIGYKVFVLKDGKLYPPMVANPDGAATPVGVWLDADAAPIAGESKTGRPQVKQGGKGTQGGSGKLAYRPGWHLGVVPYAIQFNRKDAEGNKTLFPKNFVFAEVEYAADVDYQEEARQEGINPSGKYQHSLAGLKHLPTDGYYMYRTNPNPETDPWVITGAMKVNRILTRAEQAELVKNAGREPQQIQEGDIVTDDVVNSINQEIADAPKFSLKSKPVRFEAGKKLSDEEKKEVLSTLKDAYKVNGVPYHIEETAGGKEKRVYEPTADSYVVSDITNRPLRYYITLPDGRVAHPTEVYPNISDNEVKSSATKQGLLDDEADQIVSAAIGNMNGIADNAKAVEVLTELQNLPHETHDVGYGLNNAQSYNYKTGIFTSDAAQAIDYVVRRMRRKEDVPAEVPAALKKAVADSYGMVDNLIDGMSNIKVGVAEIKPVGVGAFGNIYNQFRGKAKAAIEFLKKLGSGEATAALHHHTIGDISLVWGDKKTGLDKILRKHPEVVDNLQSIIDSMEVVQESDNRIKLESPTHFAVVSKEYKGEPREQWLLTAYEKRESLENGKSMDTATSSLGGDTALSQSKESAAKIDNSSETTKKNGEKVDSDGTKFSLKDEEYLKAVEDGNMEKAQKMVNEAADAAGYSTDSSYQGTSAFNGAAPWGNGYFLTKDERKEAWDNGEFEGESTLGDYINDDIDGGNLEELTNAASYRAADPMRKDAIDNVRNAIHKKANTITMYRSVPSDVKEGSFRNGDWVTPSRAYAVDNAKLHGWGDDYNIIEQKVPVDDVWFDGNDIAEWGYGREEDYINDTDFAYKNSKNNKKLLDAVTYDDNGNVIPLSQRFNEKNKDVRFSLKDEKTLAGVHNISEEKLLKAIKQGGLANPSVAFIDSSRQDHKAYGGISLILPSDKIAKRTGKNAGTWQGDAYTPTYPQVERHISDKGSEQVNKDVLSVPKEMQHEVRNGIYRWLDGDANSGLKYLFLHEKGVAPEPKKIQPKFSDEAYNELKFITAGDFNIYGIGKADAQKVLDMYIEAKFDGDKDLYEEKTKAWLERNKSIVDAGAKGGMRYAIAKENVELYDEYGFNYKGVQTFVRDVEYDHRKSGVDTNATLNEVEDYIKTNNLTDEFNTWLEGKEKEYGIKEVIFDGFTPSGNRRYVPNTLENVSKLMKKQGRNGATGAAVSFQNFAARLMPSYGTLKDIRSKKGLLTSDREKFDKFREKWSNVFFELGMKCQPDATGTFDDYGLARLSEAAMTSDPQAYLKKEYNVDFSDEDTKRLKEMVKAIKEEHPAMYFETKFERPVRFDEFSAAVVPTTTKKEVKEALKNAGVSIFEYDEKSDADRKRAFNEAINSSDNIRFSLKEEKEKIVADAKANGTYMTAPNGEKTKLDAEQWATVRTTNFKNWFGDWENDPENASKVVDENGEPMVVWHGRSAEFNTFEKKEGVRFIMGLEDKVKAEGFFFSPDKGLAEEFASNSSRHRGGKANVVPCFLNIRRPMDLTGEDYDRIYEDVTGWEYMVGMDTQDNLWGIMDEEGMADKIKEKGYDGAIFVEEVDDSYEPTKISYCALDANQIKSAENNNGDFSADNNDIRFSLKSMMEKPEGWKQANKKAIHIAEAIERDPKFSLKNLDGTLIKAGTYFSGGGLVEEGLKGIIDPVVAVEYDEKISGVYRNNFGQHIVTADVRDVDPRELVKQIDGEVEYFHASPVCKNYSQAKSNHAEVELDKETAASTAEFINAIKPKVVTIENVKGYKDSDAMKTITDALDANGYTWDADVYNAADYGGYTNRERLIVRAVRDGKLPAKPEKMARKSGWYEAVADIIPTLTEKKNGVANWMDIRLKADGIDWRNIDKPLYVMGSAYADGKVPHAFADELLPTLRTKSGDVIVMPDGKVYRAMGRVLARVSGVSDDYKMPFSENLSHTIIGNGIPTQLTEHVIAPLLTGSDPKFSIRTYHGTGAKFDKFDLSHDLEGEGSETFGHGVYVTNSSKIGREYAQRAKNRKMEDLYKNMRYPDGVKGDIFKRRVFGEMVNDVATGGSVASAKEFAKKRVGADANDIQRTLENLKDREKGTEYEQNLKNRLAEYKEGLKWIDSLDEDYLTQGNANRYDVDIPDDNGENYLGWNESQNFPLEKWYRLWEITHHGFNENEYFKDGGARYDIDRIERITQMKLESPENGMQKLPTLKGEELYHALEDFFNRERPSYGAELASRALSEIGFVGIKYPAGMIHGGAVEGDYNYVIFDENNANIVGNTRFSLRYDQFEHDLNQWKKDNNLPKDAQRPTIPQRNAGESAVDFLRRVDEYRKQMALWKTAPTYEQHLLSDDTALGEFNRELQRGSVLKRIAFQDSMLAIRKAQEAIMKEVGVDRLNMAEDAYTAENRSHGKGKNEFEEYNNEFLQPLRKAYHQMKKILGDSYDNVRIYMMAKHGLERDAQMAFKKSLDADFEDVAQRSAAYKAYKGDMNRIINDSDLEFGRVDFTTWRQRDNALRVKYSPSYMDYRYDKNGIAYDYSGLSALFDGSDFEEAAHKLVKDIEDKYVTETHNLWDATNAATKKILRDGYKAGMMSKDTYQYVRDMYSHYIPLRGWDGTTADQVWDYIGGGKGAFNQTLKKAHGRTSIADDPIAYIENMAESGILLNNKNWVKQHLMLLAQNHPTSLLTLSKAWYVKSTDANGNEEWIPATPQISSQMNSNQVKAAIDAFEKKMEQMAQAGDATQKRDGLNIAYPQTHSEEREHEVRVMKDGEEYVIYVNGDPQLAQAMNNTRAHRVSEGIKNSISKRVIAVVGRKMAAAYTSLSPLFIPSNYFRDLTMTLASTAIREDAKYNYLLRKNLATSWNLGFMLRDFQNGKLRDKVNNGNATPKEQMFYDFMMNGGETGFVSSLDVEDLKKKFKNDLKDLDRWKANPVKVGHTIMDSIEFLNRMIEDSNRFAVYMTSIQYGRSIDEAVNDAKDVTLNFNRKGTGEHSWQTIRNLYLFINPAVQSLQTLGALAKHHPFKFTAVTASWIASGVLVPIVNAALMQMAAAFLGGDGDDDKDWYKDISKKYWQFSKWDRRNNFIMWVPTTHEFVKIPLAQEFRAFYGLGDMIASKMMGGELAEESWEDYGWDLVGQVVDMLPLDPTGYDGNIAVSLMPNAIRPVFELAFNVDFTGKPLFKDTEYNKYDPNFTKAYVGTPDWLVRASRMMNSIGNDYPNVQQNKWDAFGDPRYNLNNPAVVDHVLSSYLGGAYTMGSQVLGLLTKSLNDRKEIKVADIPLVSKFVSNPDDRPVSKKQGDEFWDKKEYYDRASNTISKLKKQAKIDGDYSLLERFYGSEEYKTYKLYEKDVKDYKEARKKERAEESGDEYRPHQLNAEDIYNNHATPMDEFEDMKLKQLFEKLNSFKTRYDSIVDNAPNEIDAYYNINKAAIDAIDEISLDKQEISELKKGFLDDGKDAYNAEDMKQIRELRKKILAVLEKANKVVVASQKAKAEK
jgi:site-specific DNA-cytosine methylase